MMIVVSKRNVLSGQNVARSMTTLGLPINRRRSWFCEFCQGCSFNSLKKKRWFLLGSALSGYTWTGDGGGRNLTEQDVWSTFTISKMIGGSG